MKLIKRFISAASAVILAASAVLLSFPAIAENINCIKKWMPSEELLGSIADLNGRIPDFSNSPVSFESKYYDSQGIRSSSYNPNGISYIFGNADTDQYWKASISMTGAHEGFVISSASDQAMSVKFTAPASGKYIFSPEAIGRGRGDNSLYSAKGNWTVKLSVGEISKEISVAEGAYADFETLTLNLTMGDVVTVAFFAPGYKTNGYQICANFSVNLIKEEIKTVVESEAVYEYHQYTASEYLSKVTSTSFTTDYDVTPFSVISGSANNNLATWEKAPAKISGDFVWYSPANITGWGDTGYSVRAYPGSDTVQFNSKNAGYLTALVFTAPMDGTYNVTADSISWGGAGGPGFIIMDSSFSTIHNSLTVPNLEIKLSAGEKIYIYMSRNTNVNNWDTASVTLTGLKISNTELISPAVYKDKDYQFQKNADDYINEAEYLITDDDFLTVTLGGSSAYIYKVWVRQYVDEKLVWVPLEEIDYGTYALMNAYDTDGFFRFCISAYDENGVTLTTSYMNKITEIKKEEAGGAILANIIINGKSVDDKAVVDNSAGEFTLEYTGENIKNAEYSFCGVKGTFSGKTTVKAPSAGKYTLKIKAESATAGGLSDEKTVTVYVYSSKEAVDYKDITSLSCDVSADKIQFSAEADGGSIYSYYLFSFNSDVKYSANALTEPTYAMPIGQYTYGYYLAKASVRRSVYSSEDDRILKLINIKRSGGEWSLDATLDSSTATTVYGTIGNSYELSASAAFSGSLSGEDVEYCFYIKDNEGTRITLDWSGTSSWSFTPVYSGRYVLGVAAKGSKAESAEVLKEFYLDVEGETASGTLNAEIGDAKVGAPVTINAAYSGNESDNVYYRFWIITDDYTEIIQGYSLSESCVWIPKTAGQYTVRVDAINQNSFGVYDIKAEYTFSVVK